MINRIKANTAKYLGKEKGQALLLVMIFLLIGSLTLPPLLSFMNTSLKTGGVYKEKSNAIYAADSGIEDGMWQIKYGGLEALYGHSAYAYDFTTNCSYELGSQINGLTVDVTIQNVWLPSNITLADLGLSATEAKDIVERDITDNTTNRLVVTGTALDEANYRIKIDFYPAEDETDPLEVNSIGVWLPQGFTYDGGCNLATFGDTAGKYSESVTTRPGGQAVVWDFSTEPLLFTDLPPEDLEPTDNPQSAQIEFQYDTGDSSVRPAAVAWFVTSGALITDIPIAWDIDTKYYKITSVAGDAEIEAYASRSDLRNMYVATSGDYAAIGNSLMTDDNHDSSNIREHWHASSTTSLSTIPTDACVTHAYLYWSGFFRSGFSAPSYWGPDTCSNWNNWDGPNRWWSISGNQFRGGNTGSGTNTRYLEMKNPVDLHACPAGTTIVEWEQSASGSLEGSGANADYLKFQLYDGTSWGPYVTAFTGSIGSAVYYYYVIPEDYLVSQFKMRFYLDGFNESNEYCYVDNIAIARITGSADTIVDFTVDGYDTHTETVSALSSSLIGNKFKGQYSYACWQDVTDLVKAHSERGAGDDPTGNADYTVANVQADDGYDEATHTNYYLAYAGWSLIIIYYSPQTAGRQLYLWNTFAYSSGGENLDFDGDGLPGGYIKGFIIPEQAGSDPVAAKLTCFVGEGDECYSGDTLKFNGQLRWDGTNTTGNSQASPNNCWNSCSVGMDKDGVDIDTFYIYWTDGILHADDTEAYIDLETQTDNFNLIYLVLSVRSVTTISGTKCYVIQWD
jgi:hypothetical protein